MNGNATVHQVGVHPTGVLDLGNHTLSVQERVFNRGTLSQTRTVNNANVEFLHIQNTPPTITQYRGVMLDTSDNLGPTTVSVQELNLGEYCTNLGVASAAYARRCFDITPTNQPTTNVAVRLYGRTADELNGIAPASLAVYRNTPTPSGFWVEQTTNASRGSDGAYSYAQGEVAGFSPFLLGAAGQVPTAVANLHTQTSTPNQTHIPLLAAFTAVLTAAWLWLRRRAAYQVNL
jgi:hypothetical protein